MRVDVQIGQVPVAQRDEVPEGPKVRLQGGDWLPVTGDRQG